jgi:hypothetical protein
VPLAGDAFGRLVSRSLQVRENGDLEKCALSQTMRRMSVRSSSGYADYVKFGLTNQDWTHIH